MNLLGKEINISEDSIVQEMGASIVILNLKTERFYELDEVGRRFWELLTEHKEYNLVFNALQNEYEVSVEQLQKDISQLVIDLKNAELISIN